MRLVVAAVGQRMPRWADEIFEEFARRMPAECRLELKAVKAEPRAGKSAEQCKAAEAHRLEAVMPRGAWRVALDERGARRTTAELSQRLDVWLMHGHDVALLIGGPDGLDPKLMSTASETLRLSDLTLPHALARAVLAEALYRAWTLRAGHPYHRE